MIICDHQHRGKPHKPGQFGAAHDLDGDGKQERHEVETYLVESYIAAASLEAAMAGERFVLLADGHYRTRHEVAGDLAAALYEERVAYFACHLNSAETPGNYAAVFYDARSTGGQALAWEVAEELKTLEELGGNVRLVPASEARGARALSVIRRIYNQPGNISGICLEPAFINQPDHADLLTAEGLARIGRAVARGALRWVREESP